jgi:hypothetical protein
MQCGQSPALGPCDRMSYYTPVHVLSWQALLSASPGACMPGYLAASHASLEQPGWVAQESAHEDSRVGTGTSMKC